MDFTARMGLSNTTGTQVMDMKEFDIKRGHFKKIDGDGLRAIMEEFFDEVTEADGGLQAHWGALDPLTVRVQDKSTLLVETKMRADVDEDVANETIGKYNRFMEAATGFSAKERKKRAEKRAKGED